VGRCVFVHVRSGHFRYEKKKISKYERPEESYFLTEAEKIAFDYTRTRWDESVISDIYAIKLARTRAGTNYKKTIEKSVIDWYRNRVYMATLPNENLEDKYGSKHLMKALASFAYGRDIQGHPVIYCKGREFNYKKVFKDVDLSFKYGARFLNTCIDDLRKRTLRTKQLHHEMTWIIDTKDVSIGTIIWYCDSIRKAVNRIYGTTLGNVFYVFLLNPTWIVEKVLGFFSISDKVKARVVIVKDYSELDFVVKPEQRPLEYGGTCKIKPRVCEFIDCCPDASVAGQTTAI